MDADTYERELELERQVARVLAQTAASVDDLRRKVVAHRRNSRMGLTPLPIVRSEDIVLAEFSVERLRPTVDRAQLARMLLPLSGRSMLEATMDPSDTLVDVWSRVESALGRDDDHRMLALDQVVRFDGWLRRLLYEPGLAIAPAVLGELTDNPTGVSLLEKCLGGAPVTLGVVELWVIGLRRALARPVEEVRQWMDERFGPVISRRADERWPVVDAFSDRALPRFVATLRNEWRNVLAHDAAPRITLDRYRAWCEFALGSPSMAVWGRSGMETPTGDGDQSLGWLSAVLAAAWKPPGSESFVDVWSARRDATEFRREEDKRSAERAEEEAMKAARAEAERSRRHALWMKLVVEIQDASVAVLVAAGSPLPRDGARVDGRCPVCGESGRLRICAPGVVLCRTCYFGRVWLRPPPTQ